MPSSAVAPAEEVSWFAIRQPGVIRLLERRLWSADGDAFAAALELTCRLITSMGRHDGVPLPRLGHAALARACDQVEAGRCDPGLDLWIRDQLATLPVVLTRAEEAEVAVVVGAVIWAAAEVRSDGVAVGDETCVPA
ncbi:MAG: hypothetical protein KBG28_31695 [Kofleriaceae bacterium]|jgi:hypothetical protein|nr:hypothetical protein [Kofleriaceae bacterium]MBP6837285.1 hypothetical protein [Kofleriaceae bacterium]MBP9208575.1 hypothetical protein [Kofleriaceae bacterium]